MKKIISKKPVAKKPVTRKIGTTEISTAFGVQPTSLRAKILLRLASNVGKPVARDELAKEVGGAAKLSNALRVLSWQGEQRKAPYSIEKLGAGEKAAVVLKRA